MLPSDCRIQKANLVALDTIAEKMAELYNAVEGHDNPEFSPKDAIFFRERYSSVDLERDLVLAWDSQEQLVGMGRIDQIGTSAISVYVNVRPSWRGEGIGSRLFERLLDEARSREYERIRTVIPSYSPYILRLAQEQGFEVIETRIRMANTISDYLLENQKRPKAQLKEIQSADDIKTWKELQDSIFENSRLYEPMNVDALAEIQQKQGFIGYIALKNGENTGYCAGWEAKPDQFFLFSIGVINEYRHQGYGTVLLANALRDAKMKGMSKSSLFVNATNHQAIQFYEKFNYHETYRHLYLEIDK